MAEKRYYWLRLKQDFFTSKEMKKLRKIAGGDTYTIIYLKLQLLSLKDEGVLYYDGLEDTFAEELALTIDEDPDNVQVTLNYLQKCGFAEIKENTISLTQVSELIGSETNAAIKMREHRERKGQERNRLEQSSNKKEQCYHNVTKRYTEIEIETKKEKREDIEQEREIETDTDTDIPSSTSVSDKVSLQADRTPYVEVMKLYNSICTSFKRAKALSADRRKHIKARFNDGYTLDDFETLFKNAEASSWLKTWRGCDLDWLITDKYMPRVLEGKYRDRDDNDSVSHNASDPVRLDFQRYRDADGEFSVSFETLGNGRKKMTMSYDSGLTKVLEYDNDTRPTWLQ